MPRHRKRKRAAVIPDVVDREAPAVAPSTRGLSEHLLTDVLIRQFGFSIHSRQNGREAVWYRAGWTYGQGEILAYYISEEKLWEMEYRQMMEYCLDSEGDEMP